MESEPCLAGDERRPAAADTRCHLPGVRGQEPGCPCSRGQIPRPAEAVQALQKPSAGSALPGAACPSGSGGAPWSHQPLRSRDRLWLGIPELPSLHLG